MHTVCPEEFLDIQYVHPVLDIRNLNFTQTMVLDHNILRTQKRKTGLYKGKHLICYFSRSNETPSADQKTEIAPYVRIYF